MKNYDKQAIEVVAKSLNCTTEEVRRDAFNNEIHDIAVKLAARALEAESLLSLAKRNVADFGLAIKIDEFLRRQTEPNNA